MIKAALDEIGAPAEPAPRQEDRKVMHQQTQQVETAVVGVARMQDGAAADRADGTLLPAAAVPLDPAVIDMERALGMLASVGRALANPDLEPHQLNDIRAHVDALVRLLQRVGRSTVLANAAIAYRIQTERRIGQHLDTLERQEGRRTGDASDYQRVVRDELKISYKTASRWRELGEAPQDVVDDYLAQALEALERYSAGEEPRDDNGDPEPLLATAQLLRLLHTAPGSGSAGDAGDAAQVVPDDDGAGLLSLELPDALIAVFGRVLGSVDRHAGELGMRDPNWSGRVLVTPPPESAIPFGAHLLQRYESGAVSDAILVVQHPQNSAWWNPFAGWPHCLLSSAALEGRLAAPPTVFCVSESADVRGRFAEEFRRLGYLYLDGAVSESVPAGGGAGSAAVRAEA